MANTKSAEKRYRQSLKRRARNVNVRTTVKDAVKSAREAIASKDGSKTTDALKAASKTLNKAASKGVLHKRTAARRISRLAKAAAKAKA
ncbi:30S ribosomal protein S20 [Corallococcus interemptor]|uniref:Small ribosomal subunit protein bS20 n=1 Tax=Corallococcus interemptor TaxID=2316720 RepID=A0A3A8QJJ9_9BACT|nr:MULTISPECIES: 30S ribosomal protein S20 [Corallococcus]RKH45587.1 30S ribosomal protein S20 [Corallococcus sp. AB050B]MBN9686618.1 30S ribosomal protein S20 [Corallococcus sp. NCSPR001]MBZ4335364.1 30S ribosomal protein S20 [Corallococcus sp. AS-1-12]RKH65052.1 30S ribosomal protein S20 [Corallococcus interemptor]RKI65948.1 30S ribosomal protein S20 [Corallococcus sp. AB049A]